MLKVKPQEIECLFWQYEGGVGTNVETVNLVVWRVETDDKIAGVIEGGSFVISVVIIPVVDAGVIAVGDVCADLDVGKSTVDDDNVCVLSFRGAIDVKLRINI